MSNIDVTLVSITAADTSAADMSADGRFVVYQKLGSIWIKDLQTGEDRLVASPATDHSLGGGRVSDDGRLVAFQDSVQALDGNVSAPHNSFFVWDRTSGTVREIGHSNNIHLFGGIVDLSADGRTLTFYSDGTDVIPNDTNHDYDLFQADLQAGTIQRIYEHQLGGVVSPNGRYVIVDADPDSTRQNYVRLDLQTQATTPGGWAPGDAQLSADGRFLVFSTIEALLPEDTHFGLDVYLKDFSTGALRLISTSTGGTDGNGNSFDAAISADGTRVAFLTEATNFTAETASGGTHVVVKDLASGILGYVASAHLAFVNGSSTASVVALSSDGLIVAFNTPASLTSDDTDTNGGTDAYVVQFHRPLVTFGQIAGDDRVNAAEETAPITISGSSSAGGLKITVTSPNGTTASTTTAADRSWSVTISASGVSDGTHAFTITGMDDAGVTSTDSRNVLFDSVPPALVLNLNDNAAINAAHLHASVVHGTSDAIGQTVTFRIDGTVVGTATVQPPAVPGGQGDYSGTFDASQFDEGSHTLQVSVADAAGNRTDRDIFFDLDTTPPQVAILSVAGDDVVDGNELHGLVPVTGTASLDAVGQTVTITANNKVRGTAVVQADGSWAANVSLAGASASTIVFANVTDRAGNVGADTQTITVDTDIIRVSVGSHGEQGEGDPSFVFGFVAPTISPDGRFVLLLANPTSLTPDDPNVFTWVMLKDLQTGVLTVVGPGSPGQFSDGSSAAVIDRLDLSGGLNTFELIDPSTGSIAPIHPGVGLDAEGHSLGVATGISADGRYVVFKSYRTDLVAGLPAQPTGNPHERVFVKDVQTGEIKLVSFAATDTDPVRAFVEDSGIGGGRYVAFQSFLSGGANDTNNAVDIYLRDIVTGAITLVSATPTGVAGNGQSMTPDISADGRYVAFVSAATNLVPGVTSPYAQLYLRDLQTGTTTLLSAAADGTPLGAEYYFGAPSVVFTADDRYVAFFTSAQGSPNDTNDSFDVYLKDLQTGELRLLSSGGFSPTGRGADSYAFDLTPDGRYAVFSTDDPSLVPGDTNGLQDVFLRRLIATNTLTFDPVTGDNHITSAERSATMLVHGTTTVHGGALTVRIDGSAVATTTVAADGTWSATIDGTALTGGRHAFSATVQEATGFTTSGGAIVTVDEGDDHPNAAPTPIADTLALQSLTTGSGSLLANDSDPDGDALTVATIAFGATSAPVSSPVTIEGAHGRLTVAADGHYSYLATSAGQDVFTYTAKDSSGLATSSTLTVTAAPAHDATFSFALTLADVSCTGNTTLLTGPDAITYDVTGVTRLHFTDGTVDQNDGNWLVDDLFYYARHHDVWNAHADADADYMTTGWKAGFDPNAFFDTSIYLEANPDVAASGINPLVHYDTIGWMQGRSPSLDFGTRQYLDANPDVKAVGMDPLFHFLVHGAGEGRLPIKPTELVAADGFDFVYYLANNPDVAAAGVDPYWHFQHTGWHEGRDPNAYFDTAGYLADNPDVAAAHVNPLDHYHQFGWHEGRDPSAAFDTGFYLSTNPDVAAAHVDPLVHFLQAGHYEGRTAILNG
jgi:VCBS repeat-containing protein